MRRIRLLTPTLFVVLALVAAACGQKSGVAGSGGGGAGQVASGAAEGGEEFGPGEAADLGETTGGEITGAAETGAETGGGVTGGAAGPATGGATGPAAGAAGAASGGAGAATATTVALPSGPGTRTGITDKEIVIGVHAPVTGAVPVPQQGFVDGINVYWEYAKKKGGVHGGKTVKVVFRNDEFNPSRAVQVCREMVEKEKVFLLVGGGGADQTTACAKYANSVKVPYLSAGVNEAGLAGLATYFAISMSYPQQSSMLVQLTKKAGKTKLGIAAADTPSFSDAYQSMKKAAAGKIDVVYDKRIPKSASQAEALAIASEMQTSQADVIYIISSPTTFLQIAQAAQGQGYHPLWIGPGLVHGLNTVAQAGCPGVGGANMLSPFPQLDAIDAVDPNYKATYREVNGKEGDDFGIALWGLNKTLHVMFEAAGKDMSRESFMATLRGGKQFASGVFPPSTFGPGKNFGSTQAHLLQADCNANPPQYKTIARFVSGF